MSVISVTTSQKTQIDNNKKSAFSYNSCYANSDEMKQGKREMSVSPLN